MQIKLTILGAIVLAANITAVSGALGPPPSNFQVSAENVTDITMQGAWFIELAANRGVRVSAPGEPLRAFIADRAAVDNLQGIIAQEQFFGLAPTYGEPCNHCPACVLSIQVGAKRHEVRLSAVLDQPPTAAQVSEMKRALRIWKAVKELAGVPMLLDSCHAVAARERETTVRR